MAAVPTRTWLAVGCLLVLTPAFADAKLTPEQKCVVKKLAAASREAAAKLGCVRAAVAKDGTVDPLCIAKAESKFLKAFQRAEKKEGCEATGSAPAVEDAVDACVAGVEASVVPPASTSTTLASTTTSTTSSTLPTPSYRGVISIEEVAIGVSPLYGQGPEVDVRFVDANATPAPAFDEAPGSDEGCKVWELTPPQAADVGLDEGTITITGGTSSIAPCVYVAAAGYMCIRSTGTGGAIAAGPAATTATLTDLDASFGASEVAHYLRVTGAAQGNNGSFPIVGIANANTLVFLNPVFVAETLSATATWLTLSGAGVIPAAPDPGFLIDDDTLAIALTPGGGSHFAAFSPNVEAGDDFMLDTASAAILEALPLDGNAFSVGCAGAGGQCGTATHTRLVITTTDGSVVDVHPFSLPPPVAKATLIRCESTAGTTLTVPAGAAAFLTTSGATRVETRFSRTNFAAGGNPDAAFAVHVGHTIAAYTTP